MGEGEVALSIWGRGISALSDDDEDESVATGAEIMREMVGSELKSALPCCWASQSRTAQAATIQSKRTMSRSRVNIAPEPCCSCKVLK
jgi:hypothetical protein